MTNEEKEEARRRVANTCNNCAVFSLFSLGATIFGLMAVLIDHWVSGGSIKFVLKAILIGYPMFLSVCFGTGYILKKGELNTLNQP